MKKKKTIVVIFETNLNTSLVMSVKAKDWKAAKRKVKKDFPDATNFR
jgi:hypothetical protein